MVCSVVWFKPKLYMLVLYLSKYVVNLLWRVRIECWETLGYNFESVDWWKPYHSQEHTVNQERILMNYIYSYKETEIVSETVKKEIKNQKWNIMIIMSMYVILCENSFSFMQRE